jgi:tRNA(adenine34) deaminase
MDLALAQAALAASEGEVPIGAVICRGNELVAAAHNQREGAKNALAHAEILAIDAACKKLGGWRLHECVLYVTLEPCPMCAGAILNARLRRVIYGAADPKAGCFGSVTDFAGMPFNHHPEITAGIRESECAAILKDFFATLRKRML